MWNKAIQTLKPHVMKIKLVNGHGTGFLAGYNKPKNLAAIATAAHVVAEADEWGQPIKLILESDRKPVMLTNDMRVIWIDPARDSALIVMGAVELAALPTEPLPLLDPAKFLPPGSQFGWLGYPSLAPDSLCFFQGFVSAFVGSAQDYYLIDGVAVNGVSGGPVFRYGPKDDVELAGLVSAYYSNREILPGLLKAYDLTYAQKILKHMKDLDEAREAKEKVEREAAQTAAQAAGGPTVVADSAVVAPQPSDEVKSNVDPGAKPA